MNSPTYAGAIRVCRCTDCGEDFGVCCTDLITDDVCEWTIYKETCLPCCEQLPETGGSGIYTLAMHRAARHNLALRYSAAAG